MGQHVLDGRMLRVDQNLVEQNFDAEYFPPYWRKHLLRRIGRSLMATERITQKCLSDGEQKTAGTNQMLMLNWLFWIVVR